MHVLFTVTGKHRGHTSFIGTDKNIGHTFFTGTDTPPYVGLTMTEATPFS